LPPAPTNGTTCSLAVIAARRRGDRVILSHCGKLRWRSAASGPEAEERLTLDLLVQSVRHTSLVRLTRDKQKAVHGE